MAVDVKEFDVVDGRVVWVQNHEDHQMVEALLERYLYQVLVEQKNPIEFTLNTDTMLFMADPSYVKVNVYLRHRDVMGTQYWSPIENTSWKWYAMHAWFKKRVWDQDV